MSRFGIVAVFVALTLVFEVSSNAIRLPSNALSLDSSENQFKIELIDVKCDKNENGMQVTVQFAQPFDGVIYSQGFFNDPKCRYVSAGESETSYNFIVPFEGCGSKASCAICNSIDNILIIQQDEELQGEFDTARKISCSRTGIEEEKKVFFKPFVVDMLDVVSVPTSNGGVDCWMDIQRGVYPKLTPIGQVIKIGEELSVLVYLRDPKKEYDLSVRNCWAYDGADFDDKKTGKVQLSDASGCTMKRKLFGSWHKTHETGSSAANLLLHNTLRAFKFPDESQVYLKCDIEICRGNCAEAICDETNQIDKVNCNLDPLHPECIRAKVIERSMAPVGFTTLPTKTYRPSGTGSMTTRIPFAESREVTSRPSNGISTTQRLNYISTTQFDQEPTTLRPFNCLPGSRDIRCLQSESTESFEATTFKEATTNPNLFKTTTVKSGQDSFCAQYPQHKRCVNQRVTDDFDTNIEILTFKPPKPFVTIKYHPNQLPHKDPDCSLTPNDIQCRRTGNIQVTDSREDNPQPLICKGSNLDPRCPNPTPTATPPTYLPPGGTRRPIITTPRAPLTKQTTKKFLICVPGSNEVECDNIESTRPTERTEEMTTFIPSRNQYTTKKQPEKPICFTGSTNPECQKVSSDILTFKPRTSTTSIPATTRATVATTRTPICYLGSPDPRCAKETTTKHVEETTKRVEEKRVTTELPETTTYRVQSTTRAPTCYPGALDPRCKQTLTTKRIIPSTTQEVTTEIPISTTFNTFSRTTNVPRCYLGSNDPRCTQTTTKTVQTTTKTVPTFSTVPPVTTRIQISTTTNSLPTTTRAQSTTRAPVCYPGALDPRCKQATTTKKVFSTFSTTQEITTELPISTTSKYELNTSPPRCFIGSTDPRCSKPATIRATFAPITTTEQESSENIVSTTYNPTFATTKAQLRCYPGSPDPRCASKPLVIPLDCKGPLLDPRCPNPTPTAEPATYLPPFTATNKPSGFTTRIVPTLPTQNLRTTNTYAPEITTRAIPTTTTQRATQPTTQRAITTTTQRETTTTLRDTTTKPQPILTTQKPYFTTTTTTTTKITTKAPFTLPQFTTTKRIISSPQPFATRPTTTGRPSTTTTENVLCYPGSTIEGCKSSFTTPSFCYPGSKDKRCPQLPPSFSTRQPATYLPPFPDSKLNRVKRQTGEESHEVVKFSLSFKPFSF